MGLPGRVLSKLPGQGLPDFWQCVDVAGGLVREEEIGWLLEGSTWRDGALTSPLVVSLT